MRALRRLVTTPSGAVGTLLLTFSLAVILFGPLMSPYSPNASLGLPGDPPSADFLLGTDGLGRDVLSRVLHGGRSLLLYATAATAIAYVLGAVLGMLAGYRGGVADGAIMRVVDVMLAFPPLLFVLVLLAGAGSGPVPLVIGVGLIQVPGVVRLVRTTTLEVARSEYVEASIMRAERTWWILRREILPNILVPVMADAGLRFTFSVLIIAGVNFLGLGVQPPNADWGVMISENRSFIQENYFAVLAPAAMLAILTIAVNLVGDGVAQGLGRSSIAEVVPDPERQDSAAAAVRPA